MKQSKKKVFDGNGTALLVYPADIKLAGEVWPELGEESLILQEEESVAEGDVVQVYDAKGTDLGLVEIDDIEFDPED